MTALPTRHGSPPAPAATGRRAWVEQLMGMPVSVHVRADDVQRPDLALAVQNVFGHLRRADRVFSTWRPDSDLMRLRRGEIGTADAHPWMSDVIDLAIEAEDVTEGRLSAWYERRDGRRLFDPTGIVKGWAVQGAARFLQVVPRVSFCVNAGGDLTVGSGTGLALVPTLPREWLVGVEDPHDRRRIGATVPLAEGGLATSGNAARGPHIVDPRTGELLERRGSVTVVGPELVWADIWATALFVDPAGGRAAMARSHPAYRSLVL